VESCAAATLATVSRGNDLQVRIDVGVADDADDAEVDGATRALRSELLELDVSDVGLPAVGPAPDGARAFEATMIGTLVVTAGREGLTAVVRAVAGWLGRGGARSVKLQIGDDAIELTAASREDQQRLLEAFLARHSS
jgi:hypothetical protein